jgi:uncharacterized membrane protein YtjA (UPF0391 family)
MLRAAIGFFIIAILAYAIGAGGIGGVSMDIGKTLLTVFLVLAVLSFLASIIMGRKKPLLILAPFFVAGLMPFMGTTQAKADQSAATKIENKAGDLKTGAKVDARNVKGKLRDKTGHGNLLKDAKDTTSNVKDEVGNDIDKAKRSAK